MVQVAVPGELAGYWAARQRYGNLSVSWARLVRSAVRLCEEGITVSWTQADALRYYNTR